MRRQPRLIRHQKPTHDLKNQNKQIESNIENREYTGKRNLKIKQNGISLQRDKRKSCKQKQEQATIIRKDSDNKETLQNKNVTVKNETQQKTSQEASREKIQKIVEE